MFLLIFCHLDEQSFVFTLNAVSNVACMLIFSRPQQNELTQCQHIEESADFLFIIVTMNNICLDLQTACICKLYGGPSSDFFIFVCTLVPINYSMSGLKLCWIR